MVKDINDVGTSGSGPQDMTRVADNAFFSASQPLLGRELWMSDGTTGGTALVKDIHPGPGHSSPDELTAVGDTVYFAANDSNHGRELWKSDGTAAGTVLVKDISPGSLGGGPRELTAVGDTLFFRANDGVSGVTLWKSDGTEEGTVMVASPGSPVGDALSSTTIHDLTGVDDVLFFVTRLESGTAVGLWRSDGTLEGTYMAAGGDASGLTAIGDTLFFARRTPETGRELWKIDKAEGALPTLVRDISPGQADSNLGWISAADAGSFYFAVAPAGSGVSQIWKSDGTPFGTTLVTSTDHGLRNLRYVDGTLFFIEAQSVKPDRLWAIDDATGVVAPLTALGSGTVSLVELKDEVVANVGRELWMSDGTPAGTRMVARHGGLSAPTSIAELDDRILLSVTDTDHGSEPWVFDGTEAGLRILKEINQAGSASPLLLGDVGGALLFAAYRPELGLELWRSDGSAAGTHLARDIAPGPASSLTVDRLKTTVVAANAVFFVADDGASGPELWRSDGTAEGTVRVADISPGPAGSLPQHMVNFEGKLYFIADDGVHGRELWRSDGTPSGTKLLKDIRPGSAESQAATLTVAGGTLYLGADDGVSGYEVWKSDGTTSGTELLKDIVPGPEDSTSHTSTSFLNVRDSYGFTELNGAVYFVADGDNTNRRDLWRSDGSEEGTVRIDEGVPPAARVRSLYEAAGWLYFTRVDQSGGVSFWRSDGSASGTAYVSDAYPVASSLRAPSGALWGGPAVLGDTLLFRAEGSGTGVELWSSDGTAAGTALVRDIQLGEYLSTPLSSNPRIFLAVGDTVYFSADSDTAQVGRELWRTDGTEGGTTMVADIGPGEIDGFPASDVGWQFQMVHSKDRLYFKGNDGTTGEELWSLPVTSFGINDSLPIESDPPLQVPSSPPATDEGSQPVGGVPPSAQTPSQSPQPPSRAPRRDPRLVVYGQAEIRGSLLSFKVRCRGRQYCEGAATAITRPKRGAKALELTAPKRYRVAAGSRRIVKLRLTPRGRAVLESRPRGRVRLAGASITPHALSVSSRPGSARRIRTGAGRRAP